MSRKGGGGGKEKGRAPEFQRQVPSFLKQYASLLETNKNQFRAADVDEEEEEVYANVESITADGATIVETKKRRREEEIELVGKEHAAEPVEEEKPLLRPFSFASDEVNRSMKEEEEEAFDQSKAVVFVSKRQKDSSRAMCAEARKDPSKKQQPSKSLLSFTEEPDE